MTIQQQEEPLTRVEHGKGRVFPRHGRADIVLASTKEDRTLLVVEVKKEGGATIGREPVEMVLAYRDALRRDHPSWQVRPMVVGLKLSPQLLELARREGVETWRYDEGEDRLYKEA